MLFTAKNSNDIIISLFTLIKDSTKTKNGKGLNPKLHLEKSKLLKLIYCSFSIDFDANY